MISTPQTDSQELSPLEPDPGTPSGPSRESRGKASMRDLIWPAIGRSFVKLDPRDVAHNPVMFVVEVGSVITRSRSSPGS